MLEQKIEKTYPVTISAADIIRRDQPVDKIIIIANLGHLKKHLFLHQMLLLKQ